MGRATQGVKLINLAKRNDQISSVCKVSAAQEDEEEVIEEDNNNVEGGN
jgi:DNA gyrase subunit A